jgi:hypothetical protein
MWPKVLTDNVPKIAAGLVVPLAQLLWKIMREQRYEQRKADLRSQIAQLKNQRDSLIGIPATPATQAALADLEAELSAALDKLAGLAAVKSVAQAAPPENRGFFGNWLLLYVPSGFKAWCVHVLFFVTLSITIFGTIGAVSDWSGDSDDLGGLVVIGLFIVIVLALRNVARKLDRTRRTMVVGDRNQGRAEPTNTPHQKASAAGPQSTNSSWANWFLLFKPVGVWAWCVHFLFFIIIAATVIGGIGIAADWSDDPEPDALGGLGIFLLVAIGLRFLAFRLHRNKLQPTATGISNSDLS